MTLTNAMRMTIWIASGTSDNREGWWGATGFVLNLCSGLHLNGISTTESERASLKDGFYSIDGRVLNSESLPGSGLYIQVANGQTRKIIIK